MAPVRGRDAGTSFKGVRALVLGALLIAIAVYLSLIHILVRPPTGACVGSRPAPGAASASMK